MTENFAFANANVVDSLPTTTQQTSADNNEQVSQSQDKSPEQIISASNSPVKEDLDEGADLQQNDDSNQKEAGADQGYEYYDEEVQPAEYDAEYYNEEDPDVATEEVAAVSPEKEPSEEEEEKNELKDITLARFGVESVSPEVLVKNVSSEPQDDCQVQIDAEVLQAADQDLQVDPNRQQTPELGEAQHVPESDGRETADILKSAQIHRRKPSTNKTNLLSSQDVGSSKTNLNLKKQSQSANINMISYQTANFGQEDAQKAEADQFTLHSDETKQGKVQRKYSAKPRPTDAMSSMSRSKMCASMSDIAATHPTDEPTRLETNDDAEELRVESANLVSIQETNTEDIITDDLIATMTNTKMNWKVRTSTIDQLHDTIQLKIQTQPQQILSQNEKLLDVFMKLLGDQNFKIVLMSLYIINLILTQQQEHLKDKPQNKVIKIDGFESALSSKSGSNLVAQQGPQLTTLGGYVPQLIKKLADSKNIIRQQAIRALVAVYFIIRSHTSQQAGVSAGLTQRSSRTLLPLKQSQSMQPVGASASAGHARSGNNFVSLALPYLNNSSSWHVREELMHVLIICFLKSNTQFEFDSYAILEALLKALDDQKERNRFLALEAIVAFSSIGNKFSTKEIVYQLAEKQISELVSERLEAAGDMNPFINPSGSLELPYLDHIEQATQIIQQTRGREGLQSEPMKSLANQTTQHLASSQKRVNSVHKGGPGSVNSLKETAGTSTNAKRTASANNRLQVFGEDASPAQNPNTFLIHEQQRLAMQNALMVPQFNFAAENQLKFSKGPQSEYARYYQQHQNSQSKGPGGFGASMQQNQVHAQRHNFRLSHEKAASAVSHDFQSDSFLPELNKKQSKSIQHQTPLHDSHRPSGHNLNFQQQSFQNQNTSIYSAHPNMLDNTNPVQDPMHQNTYEQFVEQFGGNFSPTNHTATEMLYMKGSSTEHRHLNTRKPSSGSIKTAGPNFTQYQMTPLQQSMNSGVHGFQAHLAPNQHKTAGSRGSVVQSADSTAGPGDIGRSAAPTWAQFDPANDIGFLASAAGNFGAVNLNSSAQMAGQKQSRSGMSYAPTSSMQDSIHTNQQLGANLVLGNQSVSSSAAVQQFAQGTASSSFSRKFSRGSSQNNNPETAGKDYNHSKGAGVRAVHFAGQGGSQGNEQPDGSVQFTPQIIRQIPNSQQKNGKAQSTTYSDGSVMTRDTTTSTQIAANRLRKAQFGAGLLGIGNNIQTVNNETHPDPFIGLNLEDNQRPNEDGQKQQRQPSATSSQRRGPVKATQRIIIKSSHDQNFQNKQPTSKQQTDNASRNSGPNDRQNSGSMQNSKTELIIDSRKVKKMPDSIQQSQQFREAYGIENANPPKEFKSLGNKNGQALNNKKGSDSYYNNPYDDESSQRQATSSTQSFQGENPYKSGSETQGSGQLSYQTEDTRKNGGEEDPQVDQTEIQGSKQYLTREELEPVQGNQGRQFKKALDNLLKSQDWNVQFDSCDLIRRVTMFHQDLVLQNGSTLSTLVKQLVRLADSLRSAVARIALMTINDMFYCLKRCMEPYLEPLVQILIKRGADMKSTFICEEADNALITMTETCQENKVLHVILVQQANSRSNQHRLRVCRCLESLVVVLGNNILFFKDADKLICQLARYLSDACQDVRAHAKRAFVSLSQSIMGKNDLERLLVRVLNEQQYKKVRGYLDSEPLNFDYSQQTQSNLVITGANSGTHGNKKRPLNKGILRTGNCQLSSQNLNLQQVGFQANDNMSAGGPLSGSGLGHHVVHSPKEELKIKATSIVNPKQRIKQIQKKLAGQKQQQSDSQNLHSTKQSSFTDMSATGDSSCAENGGNFNDSVTKVVQGIYSAQHDWKARLEQMEALFNLIDQNQRVFQQFGSNNRKLGDVCDALCKLIGDQNLKIQVASLDRFSNLLENIKAFIEQNLTQIFLVLSSNLASTNSNVRKVSENILESMYGKLPTGSFVTPIVNQISFQANSRLKPTLIDHLDKFICENCSNMQLTKQILPLAYKLIDDNRTEVRQRTDKLLRKLYVLTGQQVIDFCPQAKLQKVCDTVLNNCGGSAQASSTSQTFGAVGAANLVIMQAKTTQGKSQQN